MIYDTFDSAFFITVISMIIGIVGLSIKYCLKSKCEHCNICFGLIKIDRRVELEENELNETNEEKSQI
jgi:hypothetical protein